MCSNLLKFSLQVSAHRHAHDCIPKVSPHGNVKLSNFSTAGGFPKTARNAGSRTSSRTALTEHSICALTILKSTVGSIWKKKHLITDRRFCWADGDRRSQQPRSMKTCALHNS